MDMKLYWKQLDAAGKRDLAERCNTSVAYLSQIANGHRQAGREMCAALEVQTGNAVSRQTLRPDWFDVPPQAPVDETRSGPDTRRASDGYDRRHVHGRRHKDRAA